MTTFVLVPGACHGGWWYDELVALLSANGHRGVAVTLGGLGPDGYVAGEPITLDSHIREVVDLISDDVVLVGHSYGGSVITGVADAVPERVQALVYLDAFVPSDGESCYSMTNDSQRRWYIEGSARTGIAVDPLPFFDERARPQPLATFVQASRLTGSFLGPRYFVAATDWPGGSPFASTIAKVHAEPGWDYREWPTTHNVMREGPGRVLELLLEVAAALGR